MNPASVGTACSNPFADPLEVLLPLCPFPPLGWWCAALEPGARLDASEHYQKRSFRNRIGLMTANGPQTLTVPVERRGGEPRPQDSIRRSDGMAGVKLWRAVGTAYGSAPFFEELAPEIESMFLDGAQSLGGWNRAAMAWASSWLGVAVPPDSAGVEIALPDHRGSMDRWASEWVEGHAGWPHIWSDRVVDIPYGTLSCLDVILHCGPAARDWVTPLPSSGFRRPG